VNDGRYERKYATIGISYDAAICIIKLHPAGFYKAYPDRFVNNIYFDTHEFKSFYDNIDGVSRRSKYRIRWYGEAFGHILSPVLEIKSKDNQVGYKTSHSLEPIHLRRGSSVTELTTDLGLDKLPKITKEELSVYEPKILNGYKRSYFVSRDNRFRITVDTQLHSSTIRKFNNQFLGSCKDYDSTIIELKYGLAEALAADQLSKHLLLRMTKNSKYVNAVFDNFS
jgi:hypothetical protein